MGKIDKFGSVW